MAHRAEAFARALHTPNNGEHSAQAARHLGLLHDLGKFSDAFQNYLWECFVAAKNHKAAPLAGSAPHKQQGTLAALYQSPELGGLLALPIYGHHGGMEAREVASAKAKDRLDKTKDGKPNYAKKSEIQKLLDRAASVDARLVAVAPDAAALAASLPFAADDTYAWEMYLRLLFSCIVDADALDTEAHTNPDAALARTAAPLPALSVLRDTLKKK